MSKIKINKRVERIQPSGIRAFFDLVLGMDDVISLGVGEPDFVTPWNIREAAIYSLEQGRTSYTSNKGMIELRRDISRHLENGSGVKYDPEEEIVITVGVSEAFDLALRALVDPRDKVLIPEPCYVSYGPITTLCGGVPVYLKTDQRGGFKITPEMIARSCDTKTKILILNYPNNPTGASYTRRELAKIADVVKKKGLCVISDEIYSELTFDHQHTPFAALPSMRERTVSLNGFSKSYAMTGWRIGFACGPKHVIAAMVKIHQYTMLCAPIMSQIAAREALKRGDRSVHQMKREYRRRRDYVTGELNEMGLACAAPGGAFYVFPSITDVTGRGSIEFAKALLKEERVAVIPGGAFGSSFEGFIRIAYASSMEDLKEALTRIKKFITRKR
ncbi:MAG: aminotransferase class I/II-fold pyridoxal phosphate-dependent enzyme [Candidatus Omnitrophota bacterium]